MKKLALLVALGISLNVMAQRPQQFGTPTQPVYPLGGIIITRDTTYVPSQGGIIVKRPQDTATLYISTGLTTGKKWAKVASGGGAVNASNDITLHSLSADSVPTVNAAKTYIDNRGVAIDTRTMQSASNVISAKAYPAKTISSFVAGTDTAAKVSIANTSSVVNLVDDYTGEPTNLRTINAVPDSVIDNVMLFKVGSNYYERIVSGELNIQWFGGKGDYNTSDTTGTDNSIALQKAINYLVYKNFVNHAVIYCPAGKYKFLHQVHTYPNILIKGDAETYFYFNRMVPNNQVCIRVLNPTGTEFNYGNRRLIFENIRFIGNINYSVGDDNYRNSTCIQFNVPHLQIDKCTFHGFYAPHEYFTDAYIIEHTNCTYSFNFYGVYFNGNGQSNLGENITFENCTIGNNVNGIFNYWGDLNFIGGSVDYNKVRQVAENNNYNGGLTNTSLTFTGVHLEANPTDPYPYVNNGHMTFVNCNILNAETGSEQMFLNDQSLTFLGNTFMLFGNSKYMVVNMPPTEFGNRFITEAQINMFHPDLSQVYNSDFEDTLLNGWNTIFGTSTIDTVLKHNGSRSIKISGSGTFYAGEVVSNAVPINKSFARIFVSAFVNSGNLSGDSFYTLTYYDDFGNEIKHIDFLYHRVASVWQNVVSDWQNIPNGATKFTITLKSEVSASHSVNYDDVYVAYK